LNTSIGVKDVLPRDDVASGGDSAVDTEDRHSPPLYLDGVVMSMDSVTMLWINKTAIDPRALTGQIDVERIAGTARVSFRTSLGLFDLFPGDRIPKRFAAEFNQQFPELVQ